MGVDRHGVGSDLVGKVAVGGHAVTPHYSQVNLPLGHQAGGHVVRDQAPATFIMMT